MERVWRIRACVMAVVWITIMMGGSALNNPRPETFLVMTLPTHPGEPHALRFNIRANGTSCELLVSLFPWSASIIDVDHNGGLWRAEEIRFLAVDRTVNLTFAADPRCGVQVGNVEVGLEDDYVKSVTLRTRLACVYALVGAAAVAVAVAFAVGSVRSRHLLRL